MSVLNQNNKLQSLDNLNLEAVSGGLTTRETVGGQFVNLVDHSGTYSSLESAQTAADALCDANGWFSNDVRDLNPVELADGNWGLMRKNSGVYGTKDDAAAAGRALEKLTHSY